MTIRLEAQTDSVRVKLEKYIPFYIIDNYCSKIGFRNIMKEVKFDDRVGKVLLQKSNSPIADSSFGMEYNNTVIEFMRHSGVSYLENFIVYFTDQSDMVEFKRLYFKILDPKGRNIGEGKMNNILIDDSEKINGYPYQALCFVYQWDFCGKDN